MTTPNALALLRWQPPERVRRWSARHSFTLRLTVTLVAIAAAYHYSLLTLMRALGLETPLAYLGLVPAIALGLGLMRARPGPEEPSIHDREIDVIVGVPLLLTALLIITVLPGRLSSLFWVWRIDLLSLPFFVAGVVTLVFGVRSLWRLRVPIGFLLLAWPLPYTAFLSRWLDGFTDLTVAALRQALTLLPVGRPAPGSDGSLFAITHDGKPFVLSVASSCSGVNGVVGFLLIGIAFTSLVQGRRLSKALWLVGGMLLIWGLNLVRLLLIFWVGQSFGEGVAIDGLHPFIGVLLFSVGIVAMLLSMPLFGLSIPLTRRATKASTVPYHRIAVPRARGAVAVVLSLAVVMGVTQTGMRHYELVAGDLGAARLVSFTTSPAAVPGFHVANVADYLWSRRFFGSDSTWLRYAYYPRTSGTSLPVTADVVSTSSLGRFSDYGIEACYRFHGFEVDGKRSMDLGGGVVGNLLTYTNPAQHLQWSVVYWIWPVKTSQGSRFERVALLVPSKLGTAAAVGPQPRTDPVRGLGSGGYQTTTKEAAGAHRDSAREFVVQFARSLVSTRPSAGVPSARA